MIRRFFSKILICLFYSMLRLRYKFVVKGLDVLKDKSLKNKGVLLLPNHPTIALDPFIIKRFAGKYFDLIPLVTEDFHKVSILKPFMWCTRAKPVASFDSAVTDYKYKQTEKLYLDVVEDLKKGEKVMLYPAAGIKKTAKERIGGRSLAYRIMQDAPDTEVIVVRVSGLWGSSFSAARNKGVTPNLAKLFVKSISLVFSNLLFFSPRRKVLLEFAKVQPDFPVHGTKMEFNGELEKFYNSYPSEKDLYSGNVEKCERHEEEPMVVLREFFWKKDKPQVEEIKEEENVFENLYIPGQVRRDILFELSKLSGKSVKDIGDNADLVFDIGLDSMDIATMYTHIDTHFELDSDIEPKDLKTVKDLYIAAMHLNKKKKKQEKEQSTKGWPHERKQRKDPEFAKGSTIIEAFLNSCDRLNSSVACSDPVSGVLSYHKMKLAALILSKKIRKLDGDYIGILLPSTAGTYILNMAIYLAGKTPVPLNWTVGTYFMSHAIELMDLKHIISSKKFLQRIDKVDLGIAMDRMVLLEDMRKQITLMDKLEAVFNAKRSAKSLIKKYCGNIDGDSTAVVLFTSGSTALPKAVPLTHKNVLSNQKAALKNINLHKGDVLLKCLPPFHVFGWSLGIMPLLLGVRVCYSPDPLDGPFLSKQILKWKCSVVMMAPTFLAHLFKVASIGQLKPLRLVISGAEKPQASLLEFIEKLGHVKFIEGYGLTETSPIITCGDTNSSIMKGVGKVVDSCELLIVNTDTQEKASGPHQIGEIVVTGDSIFSGYYKKDNRDVFMQIDGKNYYKTGDLGYLDEAGNLFLTGRLKLSFKRGGEMISATAIEATLTECAIENKWVKKEQIATPIFAVVPKEKAGAGTKIVLFSTISLSLDQVNQALKEKGFARLYKINEIIELADMPLLKTGKICYRKLFDQVNKMTV